ncbi:hypothetical protein [Streptosporangium sp. 'caverna']|uniref:hypothetical protein n=1 Tax=Streptosporangium sp. 'caverna' TaxID=2202249 RepID=UPI000D7E0C70|nr:hypothetical protein [Streptosporangium sp. 'caverna']AWS43720.1 hypothetical protein DKM19_22555 [Streptosporangium sp. 'caverna']
METSPVGKLWVTNAVRGLTAGLERLRIDRQLEEALTRGPDPLHLVAVSGINDKAALRYANAARRLLQTAAETPEPPAHHFNGLSGSLLNPTPTHRRSESLDRTAKISRA